MTSYQCRCLSPQSGLTKTYRYKTICNCQIDLFLTKVTFRTNQHKSIFTRLDYIFKQRFLSFVTVSNKLLSTELSLYKLIEVCHIVQYWFCSLQRLLNSRDKNLVHSFTLYHLSFRESAVQKCQFI